MRAGFLAYRVAALCDISVSIIRHYKIYSTSKQKQIMPDEIVNDIFESPDWSKRSKNGDYIILTDPRLPKTF